MNPEGILVACDKAQEWMLPWWWLHYRMHNRYPVTFVDLGMSAAAKAWCKKRGHTSTLNISDAFVARREEIDPLIALSWDGFYQGRNFWPARLSWFKKPLALLQTPYQKTLWIDLDCQIRADLTPLFAQCENPSGIAVVRDRDPGAVNRDLDFTLIFPDEIVYNSGVIVYKKGSPVVAEFAKRALKNTKEFIGDQHILSRILHEKKEPFTELPRRYNTWTWKKPPPDTAIFHWVNESGKAQIRSSLEALDPFFFNHLSLQIPEDAESIR